LKPEVTPVTASEENQRLVDLEHLVLRALCRGTPQGSLRQAARRILAGYRWHDPLYESVFKIIMSLPSDDPQVVRDELPARLTRSGFPDFDLDDFFRPVELSHEQVLNLMNQMNTKADT